MNRKIYCFCLLLACVFIAQSQTVSKIDLKLRKQLERGMDADKSVSLLAKGNEQNIRALCEKYKGTFKYSYQGISSVQIPAASVIAFSNNKAVEKIENTQAKGKLLMDSSRIRNNVDSVHAGFAPLTSGLKGNGVIMGIIDGGIYFQHGDFRKPTDSTTRIRYIWDQDVSGNNAPLPYSYGNQWNWLDIDNSNCTHVPPASDFGHGTCVAGIAAGNGLSVKGTPYEGLYHGVAPETEIIAVKIKEDENFLANVADAVDYIFKKADALGKPCVINTSIGTYYGSHDGNDLATHLIESLLEERNGRSLVAAAGNAGDQPHHLGYQIQADSAYTFFKYNTFNQEVYFDLWADTAEFRNVQFAVGCNDTLGTDLGRISYLTVPADFNPAPGTGIIVNRNLFTSTSLLGQISIQATLDDNRYHVEFLVTPANTSHYWRLQTTGSGKFDLWSSSALIGSADMTSYIRTGDTANPQIFIQYPNYRHPDTLQTIVSSWQCSDKVITVGNYSNRAGYFDRDSVYRDMTEAPFNEIPGKRFATSSFGPTRDSRLKPDVMATGSTTICTGDAGYIALATSAANRKKVSVTVKHIRNGGTSMASPVVAGIAALYLEQHPTATYDEIKEVITCTAFSDNFTGSTPNTEYGHGKVNGFAAITASSGCITFGAKDTACINYNSLANVDSGGCVAKVYGCMDTAASNYNPQANMSDGSCTFTGLSKTDDPAISVRVMPNPFGTQTTFVILGARFDNGSIKIFNQLGEQVDALTITAQKNEYVYRNTKLAAGLYHYAVQADGRTIKAGKLVVE